MTLPARIFPKLLPLLLATVLFYIVLWCLGFPQPTYDDLFYTGAALHMAAGGDFSNPLIARQMFPSHYFFVYPPLHSYVLAGWLKVFGISCASQTGFMIVNSIIICAATLSILRRRKAPGWALWLVPLGAAFAFLPAGLRPETLATALVMAGFDLSERRATGRWLFGLGFVLMMLGASCAPRVTFFAIALAACSAYEGWKELGPERHWMVGVWWAGSICFTGLVFLSLIHWRLHEFWVCFHLHASRVSGKPLTMLADFRRNVLGIFQLPLVLLPLGLMLDAIRKPWHRAANAGLFVVIAMVPVILSGGLGHGSIWWIMFPAFIFAAICARNHAPRWNAVVGTIAVLAFLLADRKIFANMYGIVSDNISREMGQQAEQVRSMRTEEHPLLVDGAVARYLFDYRLPEGVLDFEFGAPFPGGLPGDISRSELRPGDVYAVGPVSVEVLTERTYLKAETPYWCVFNIRGLCFPKYPRHVQIVRSEDCKDTRPWEEGRPAYLPKAQN